MYYIYGSIDVLLPAFLLCLFGLCIHPILCWFVQDFKLLVITFAEIKPHTQKRSFKLFTSYPFMNLQKLLICLNTSALNVAYLYSLPLSAIYLLILIHDKDNTEKTLKTLILEVEQLTNTHSAKIAAERLINDNYIVSHNTKFLIGSSFNRFYSLSALGREVLISLQIETDKQLKSVKF